MLWSVLGIGEVFTDLGNLVCAVFYLLAFYVIAQIVITIMEVFKRK